MLKIQGDLDLMTLPEILQWAESGRKNGTLTLSHAAVSKYFFFQNGKIIYFSSPRKGERLGELLLEQTNLSRSRLESLLVESKKLGIPFTSYLVSEKIIPLEKLKELLETLVRVAITDSLAWNTARFEFIEHIPQSIQNGSVKLEVTTQLFVSAVQFDEITNADQGTEQIMAKLQSLIADGQISLPPTPDIMQKLDRATRKDGAASTEIVKIIMADQILTSKILKVVNSSFYSLSGKITTLQHAINIIGMNALKSIATAHALGNISGDSGKKILPILRHSLLTAFLAKKIGKLARRDPEELFVCGIMHDLGKTVLLEFLRQYELSPEARDALIKQHHAHVGYLLAQAWQLSLLHQETIRYHHDPQLARSNSEYVWIIHHADILANAEDASSHVQAVSKDLMLDAEQLLPIIAEIDVLRNLASALV